MEGNVTTRIFRHPAIRGHQKIALSKAKHLDLGYFELTLQKKLLRRILENLTVTATRERVSRYFGK